MLPAREDAEPLEAALRNLISVCCLSETVAVSLIGAERLEMPEGPLRELLTRIYADECGHSNYGWRLLPDSGADARRLFYATVEQVIVPNLEALGVPAGRAWALRGEAGMALIDETRDRANAIVAAI